MTYMPYCRMARSRSYILYRCEFRLSSYVTWCSRHDAHGVHAHLRHMSDRTIPEAIPASSAPPTSRLAPQLDVCGRSPPAQPRWRTAVRTRAAVPLTGTCHGSQAKTRCRGAWRGKTDRVFELRDRANGRFNHGKSSDIGIQTWPSPLCCAQPKCAPRPSWRFVVCAHVWARAHLSRLAVTSLQLAVPPRAGAAITMTPLRKHSSSMIENGAASFGLLGQALRNISAPAVGNGTAISPSGLSWVFLSYCAAMIHSDSSPVVGPRIGNRDNHIACLAVDVQLAVGNLRSQLKHDTSLGVIHVTLERAMASEGTSSPNKHRQT